MKTETKMEMRAASFIGMVCLLILWAALMIYTLRNEVKDRDDYTDLVRRIEIVEKAKPVTNFLLMANGIGIPISEETLAIVIKRSEAGR